MSAFYLFEEKITNDDTYCQFKGGHGYLEVCLRIKVKVDAPGGHAFLYWYPAQSSRIKYIYLLLL